MPANTAPSVLVRREMPHWGEPYPNQLKRGSLKAALADYVLQANYDGYHPDRRKVLAVKIEDRTTILRNAATPLRHEVYDFVEGGRREPAGFAAFSACLFEERCRRPRTRQGIR